MRIARLSAAGLGAGAILALAAAPFAASAHVTVDPADASAGAYTVLTFSVGHGCDGSPTTAMTVDIPEGILSVTPTVKSGWTIEKVMVPLDEPATDSHGESVSERVGQVVYTAGTPLPDGYRDTIQIQVRMPDDAAGETLAFPVLQTCETGETNWNELPNDDGSEPELPAPVVNVGEATGDGHGSTGSGDDASHDEAHGDATSAEASSTDHTDVLARVLGIGGLAVGVIGIVLAITARASRKSS